MRYPQAVLVSCEIPWDDREQLDERRFRREVQSMLAKGFRHVYVFGTAGEGYAVDSARFREIVSVFREETRAPGIHAQVGIIDLSTARIIESIGVAHELGFRAFQISLPSWGALNDGEVLTFFRDVCGAFPDSKFLHYNLPRAKRELTAGDYRRAADAVENLAATKNTGTTVASTAQLMKLTPEIQHFFGEAMFPTGSLHGACSLLSSFAPMIPTRTKEFFEYAKTGQIEKLFRFQKEYLDAVEDVIAPLRRRALIDGAYDKVLVRLGGIDMPLRMLSPYEAFSEDVFEECRSILHSRYSTWLG